MSVWDSHVRGYTVWQGLGRGGINAGHSALQVHAPPLSALL